MQCIRATFDTHRIHGNILWSICGDGNPFKRRHTAPYTSLSLLNIAGSYRRLAISKTQLVSLDFVPVSNQSMCFCTVQISRATLVQRAVYNLQQYTTTVLNLHINRTPQPNRKKKSNMYRFTTCVKKLALSQSTSPSVRQFTLRFRSQLWSPSSERA